MSNSPNTFDADDADRDSQSRAPERPALTPALEIMHGDGYRWASVDVMDLDPPTTFPPEVVHA